MHFLFSYFHSAAAALLFASSVAALSVTLPDMVKPRHNHVLEARKDSNGKANGGSSSDAIDCKFARLSTATTPLKIDCQYYTFRGTPSTTPARNAYKFTVRISATGQLNDVPKKSSLGGWCKGIKDNVHFTDSGSGGSYGHCNNEVWSDGITCSEYQAGTKISTPKGQKDDLQKKLDEYAGQHGGMWSGVEMSWNMWMWNASGVEEGRQLPGCATAGVKGGCCFDEVEFVNGECYAVLAPDQ